jgi:iron complex outermembrane receptor protein
MTMASNYRFKLSAMGALAAGLMAGAARAETPTPADAAPAAGSAPTTSAPREPLELQEIVVTGDRKNTYSADLVQAGSFRGARQMDTPLTIAVIPQEVIQSQQAIDLLDTLRNTAGVTSSNLGPTVYNNIAIRGIVVDSRSNFRLNGSLPILSSIAFPLEDKDRVEALKGASALYYGFSAPAGVVNLTMARPTATPFTSVTAFGNEYGAAGGHIDTGGTFGMFGYRVNGVYSSVDAGIDNSRGTRGLISGAFDIKPTDRVTINLDAEHFYKIIPEPAVFRITTVPKSTIANPYPTIRLPPLLDPSTNFGASWMKNDAVETNLLSKVNFKINDAWAVTGDFGTSTLDRERRQTTLNPTNIDTGEGTLSIGLQRSHFVNKNGRIEIAGTFQTGPVVHELLVGTSRNVKDSRTNTPVRPNCPPVTPGAAPAPCTQNFFDPRPVPEFAIPVFLPADTTRIDDRGYYAFERAKIGSRLDLLAGVRKSDYTESDQTTAMQTFHATPVSPSYGVVYKLLPWISLYGTYIEGLESTSPGPTTAINANVQLGPSNSKQWEGGVKIEPRPGVLFQTAYFDISRDSAYVNGANFYVKDGRAAYRGVEVSLTGEVTPDLSIIASGMYLDAKQDSGAPTIIVGNTITPTAVGKEIEDTAKQTYSLAGEYRLSALVSGLSATAGVYYVGPQAVNSLNQAFTGGYTTFDVGAAYVRDFFGQQLTMRVNGQNITNKRYWASTGTLFLAEGPPALVKFSVSTRF